MIWEKLGLVYGPDERVPWAVHSALQPTPYRLDDDTIRVFCGMRDNNGISRVGYVDVAASDPTDVKDISKTPALEIGQPGTFDENGVVPCAVVPRDGGLHLYYAGYQLG